MRIEVILDVDTSHAADYSDDELMEIVEESIEDRYSPAMDENVEIKVKAMKIADRYADLD